MELNNDDWQNGWPQHDPLHWWASSKNINKKRQWKKSMDSWILTWDGQKNVLSWTNWCDYNLILLISRYEVAKQI
jgi:hypothetical protein